MIVGGAQETVLLAAALADRERFDPVVVTGPQTGSEGSLHQQAAERGVRVVVVPDLVREVSPRRDVRVVPALVELLRELHPHVVHTHSSKAGVVGRLAARRARVPGVVHTVHGWPFHEHQPRALAAVWREVERRTAPLADRLVVVAEADRDKGLAAGVGRVGQYLTVRSGMELGHYAGVRLARRDVRAELGVPVDAALIGSVMRLSAQKDPLTVVDAFRAVAQQRPEAWLLVVGDGPLRERVEARLHEAGLRHRAVLTGLRADVPRLLGAMDVFLSASRWEGLPRTVVAAMASGTPVVATPVDGVRDVLQDGVTGLVGPPGQGAALGGAVLRMLTEPGLAQRMSVAAMERVREFDATHMVRQLEQLYLELSR